MLISGDDREVGLIAPAGSIARLRRFRSDPDIFGLGQGPVERVTKGFESWVQDKALLFLVGGALLGLGAYRMTDEHPFRAPLITASGLLVAVGVVPFLFEVLK